MVKDKLKVFLVAILVALFDGAVLQACEQGNLVEAYRPAVRDVDSHVLTATDTSDYGEPKIKANSENADKYTEILKTATSLQVFLKDIQMFEETTASQKNAPSLRIDLVDFASICPIQRVNIEITIIDTNNNDPLFTDENGDPKNIFEVEVPMPLPKNIELQNFGAKIYAKDVDLTNTRVTFSIEPEDGGVNDLDIQYGNVVDKLNKVHSAILKSPAALNYKERTYIITVEDEGTNEEGKRIATGILIVKRNEQESIITPKFEKSFYIARLEDHRLEDLVVIVEDGNGKVPVIVEEEMRYYFQVTTGRTLKEFIVKGLKDWDEYVDAIFTLQINGPNIPSPIETVVIGKIDRENLPRTTYFEHPLYTGNFENHLAKLEVNVINGIGKIPVIKGDEDITEYFAVFEADRFFVDRFIVQSIKDWDKNIDAIFTLKIDDSNLAAPIETVVIIKQEKVDQPEPPRFEKSHYIGTYKNGQLSIPHINLLCVQKCDVKFEDAEMEQIFSPKNEDGSVTIEQVGLIQEDLEEILLIVVAEEDGLMGSTVVLVKIIKDACEQGNLVGVYRFNVRDVDNDILTTTDMSDYGEPTIKANSENADKYTKIFNQATCLQVFLKDIQKFEETTASQKNAPSLRIELVNFAQTCPIQRVDIRITIIDTNNNDPVFTDKNGVSKDTFEVNVPMYFPKKVESFEAIIYAKDIDLTNTKVTFSIEPEDGGTKDLDIEYGEVVDDLNKVHSAIIRSTAALNYQNRRYMVTVEDEGTKDEGKRTASGMITVKRNQEKRVITLKFEKSSYTARLEDHKLEDLNL